MGSGRGCCPGCGFICSVLCAVVAWLAFLLALIDLFLPMWQRYERVIEANGNSINVTQSQGLFLCCVSVDGSGQNFTDYTRSCTPCSDLEDIEWKGVSSLTTFTLAVACLAVCAVGSLLMACDKCRGCVTASIYMVFALAAFLASAASVVLYSVDVDWDFNLLWVGYWIATAVVTLSLVASIVFCQAMCTTMDLCPCC